MHFIVNILFIERGRKCARLWLLKKTKKNFRWWSM